MHEDFKPWGNASWGGISRRWATMTARVCLVDRSREPSDRVIHLSVNKEMDMGDAG